jgi:hypothetical protein
MKRIAFYLVFLTASLSRASAAPVTEAEVGGIVNNSRGTAQVVHAASFTTPAPATVFSQPGWATATIVGTNGSADVNPSGDVDFYQFSTSGGRAMFDVDNDPFTFDAMLFLFDGMGTLAGGSVLSLPIDAGSAADDPFLGVMPLAAGTYFIAVSEDRNFPIANLEPATTFTFWSRPDSGFGGSTSGGRAPGNSDYQLSGVDGPKPYTLHISLENVPEPSTAILGLLGLAGGIMCRALGPTNGIRRGSQVGS